MKLDSNSQPFGSGLMSIIFSVLIFCVGFFFSCDNSGNRKINNDMPTAGQELPPGFEDFYKKFHRDSAFQMQHITFPLQGIPDFADSLDVVSTYYWTKEEWLMHRELDLEEGNYNRVFKSNDYIVEEVIRDENDFGTIRRFYLVDGDWNLIYYAGMNLLRK